MTGDIRGSKSNTAEKPSCQVTPPPLRLRAFLWTYLLNGASNEITTLVVIDSAANEVLAVLNRHGGSLDPVTEADVQQGLKNNAELLGGCYAALADGF